SSSSSRRITSVTPRASFAFLRISVPKSYHSRMSRGLCRTPVRGWFARLLIGFVPGGRGADGNAVRILDGQDRGTSRAGRGSPATTEPRPTRSNRRGTLADVIGMGPESRGRLPASVYTVP